MPIITSSQTSWLEFQKGALDYTAVPPGQVRAAQNMPQVEVGRVDGQGLAGTSTSIYVEFNMTDKVVGGSQGLELRKAMYAGADGQSFINIVLEGQGVPATGINPQGMPGCASGLSPYKDRTDPAGASMANSSPASRCPP